MGGGGSQTTTPPPATEQELALQQTNLDVARQQLEALKRSNDFQARLFESAGPLIEAQTGLLKQQLDRANSPEAKQLQDAQDAFSLQQLQQAGRLAPIQEEILNRQLEALRNGGAATPEQKALIEKATQGQIDAGNISIDRNAADAMRVLGSELAPSLGLSSRDTPIQDRAALVAAETVRQKGSLEAGLRGQAASTELGLPLQSASTFGGLGLATSGQISPLEQFQQELQSSATTNRLQLFGGTGNFLGQTNQGGIGLANIAPNGVGFRPTGATTTTLSSNPSFAGIVGGIGSLAGGIGGAATGFKSVFGPG